MEKEELSLFGENAIAEIKAEEEKINGGKITVTNVLFVNQEELYPEDLFNGFDELYVATYSYSVKFIEKIMKNFQKGEVILGFENLVNSDVTNLLAHNVVSTNTVIKNQYLNQRMQAGEFNFHVLSQLVSHEKFYLLKANDGRTRVVWGSANFSARAWAGKQQETYTVCDSKDAYNVFFERFTYLKSLCSEIKKEAKLLSEDHIDIKEIPFFRKIEKVKATIIETVPESQEVKNYYMHEEKVSEEFRELLKRTKIKPNKKDAGILFDIKTITVLSKEAAEITKEKKEQEKENPQFILNYENQSASYNGEEWNLNPLKEDVKKDANNLIEYMKGFDNFTKDKQKLKTTYWKVLNYMFLSPFMARMRYEGNQNKYPMRFFPMYCLVYGTSDAGKTTFIKLCQHLMFGEFAKQQNELTESVFSPNKMLGLKTNIKGCPIVIDEMSAGTWNRWAKSIVKADDFLVDHKLLNHPSFMVLSNDVAQIEKDVRKRVVMFRVDNSLDTKSVNDNAQSINILISETKNAFYREYLRRMFVEFENLIEEISIKNNDNQTKRKPDIFLVSSKIILEILKENKIDIPLELNEFTYDDYTGDREVAYKAISIINDEFELNPRAFSIDRTKNQLIIDFSIYPNKDSVEKTLKLLVNDLPRELEAKHVNFKLVTKLSETEAFLERRFKKNFLSRLRFWK